MLNRLTYLWKATLCGPFLKSYLGEIDFTFYKDLKEVTIDVPEGMSVKTVRITDKDSSDRKLPSDVKDLVLGSTAVALIEME